MQGCKQPLGIFSHCYGQSVITSYRMTDGSYCKGLSFDLAEQFVYALHKFKKYSKIKQNEQNY